MTNILTDSTAHPVIGHRGMAGAAPENTIEAMQLAFDYGADAIEFDLHLTADGQVVVIHDSTVDRTTEGTGAVESKTFAEIRELDASARFVPGQVEDRPSPPRAGHDGNLFPEYAPDYKRPHDVRVPLFREVLERFPDKHLLIEIKAPRAAAPARTLIEQFAAEGRCMVDSYHASSLDPFRGSRIPIGAGKEGVLTLLKSYFLRRSHSLEYNGICIPTNFRRIPLPIRTLARMNSRNGKTTNIWTINSPEEARRLWRSGVNGIVTDDVRPILAGRNAA